MREEQRRSPPGPLVSADWCPPEGYRGLGEAWKVDRGESGIDRVPKAGAVDEYQGRYASRLGERQAEGYETTERVADVRRAPYAQGVDERDDEPLEKSGRVVGGRSGAVGGTRQVRSVDPVGRCQGRHHQPPVEGVVTGSVQQHQGRTFARTKIADGQPVDLDILLFNGYVHLLRLVISATLLRE